MSTTTTEPGPFQHVVTLEISDAELETASREAARRLSRELKIPGFRPGKAPRPVVEATVGESRLRTESIEIAIPPKLEQALAESDLDPAVTPSVERLDDIEGGVSVDVLVTTWPSLESPPPYRDRELAVESPQVSEEELDSQVARMLDQYATVEEVEREADTGDYVSLDLTATKDGEDVEEAKANDILYEIGSGLLIEGLDEYLIGASAGSEVTFEGKLPDGFGDSAGEEVTFNVTVLEVKEKILPEFDDEWVEENTEFDTKDALIAELSERMADVKKASLARSFSDDALGSLVEQVEVDLPEPLVLAETQDLLDRFVRRLSEQEVSVADYFQATGITQDQLIADVKAQAVRAIRTRMVLEAVAADAGLSVDDTELAAVVEQIAATTDDPERYRAALLDGPAGRSVRDDLIRDKALQLILENTAPVDGEGNPVDLTVPESEEQVFQGEVVDGEIVEGEIVEGEVVADATEGLRGDDKVDTYSTDVESVAVNTDAEGPQGTAIDDPDGITEEE